MKKKDMTKLRDMDINVLEDELHKKRKEMGKIVLEMKSNPAKDTNIIRKMKGEQARILTIINEKKQSEKK